MSARKPILPHYSGKLSVEFWRRVNTSTGSPTREVLYYAGVLLQEMESRVLRWLADAEKEP